MPSSRFGLSLRIQALGNLCFFGGKTSLFNINRMWYNKSYNSHWAHDFASTIIKKSKTQISTWCFDLLTRKSHVGWMEVSGPMSHKLSSQIGSDFQSWEPAYCLSGIYTCIYSSPGFCGPLLSHYFFWRMPKNGLRENRSEAGHLGYLKKGRVILSHELCVHFILLTWCLF